MTDGVLPDLVLASASPRRRELLEQLGLALRGDARQHRRDAPARRAPGRIRAARRRREVRRRRRRRAPRGRPPAGLPSSAPTRSSSSTTRSSASPPTRRTRGGCCSRWRGAVTTSPPRTAISFGGRTLDRAVTTAVSFRSLQPAELDAYVASGEWQGKAGGYAVQGRAGAFVTELRGSHTNVIGLPLAEVLADLQALEALPALSAGGVRRAAGDVTRAEQIADNLARRARAHRRAPRAPPGARPARSACSRSARRCPPTTCAPRSPPASARSARTTPRSCATRAPCSPTIRRCRRRPNGTSSARCRATR